MFIIRISFAHTTPKPQKGAKRVEEQNRRSGRGRRVKLAAVYLLAALAAALGWLNACLPDRVYLEPEQALVLPRFGWVEPLRLHGSQNVVSTRAVGSYQTTLALGGWLPVKTIRTVVTTRPSVTVCGITLCTKRERRTPSSLAVAVNCFIKLSSSFLSESCFYSNTGGAGSQRAFRCKIRVIFAERLCLRRKMGTIRREHRKKEYRHGRE